MVAERRFNGAVQDDLDWLDKNRLTDNDEFIDVPVPQNQEEVDEVIQTIPSKCISERLLEQVVDVIMPQIQGQIAEVVKILLERVQQILLERVQHRFVEQIADAHASSVADETVECETGFEWPANERTVCLTTNSTTANAHLSHVHWSHGRPVVIWTFLWLFGPTSDSHV